MKTGYKIFCQVCALLLFPFIEEETNMIMVKIKVSPVQFCLILEGEAHLHSLRGGEQPVQDASMVKWPV